MPEELELKGNPRHAAWAGRQVVLLWEDTTAFYTPEIDRWQIYRGAFNPELDFHARLFWTGLELVAWSENKGHYLYP
jgi:hypothetical protein